MAGDCSAARVNKAFGESEKLIKAGRARENERCRI
jgi:hypothetical protein